MQPPLECDLVVRRCSVKAYHDRAVAAGIPALTTAGIYPGTSNVMAAHIVSISRGEYDDNWKYKEPLPGELAYHQWYVWAVGKEQESCCCFKV